MEGTWSSYQSLIQLAVGLNFGYAGFRQLVRPHLNDVIIEYRELLTSIQKEWEERRDNKYAKEFDYDAGRLVRIHDELELAKILSSFIHEEISDVCIFSGVASVGLLFFASEYHKCAILYFDLAIIVFFGFFAVSLIFLLSIYIRLRLWWCVSRELHKRFSCSDAGGVGD